jgi:hypothetical protein
MFLDPIRRVLDPNWTQVLINYFHAVRVGPNGPGSDYLRMAEHRDGNAFCPVVNLAIADRQWALIVSTRNKDRIIQPDLAKPSATPYEY